MNWLLSHLDDADINDPIQTPTRTITASSRSSSSAAGPPTELVSQLTMMGFPENRCIYALQQTNNSIDRAIEWLFSHADEEIPSLSTSASSGIPTILAGTNTASPYTSSRYRLYACISHLGKSTAVGHYVCHLRSHDNKWVLFNDEKVSEVDPENEADVESVGKGMDRAYMYIYQRIDS